MSDKKDIKKFLFLINSIETEKLDSTPSLVQDNVPMEQESTEPEKEKKLKKTKKSCCRKCIKCKKKKKFNAKKYTVFVNNLHYCIDKKVLSTYFKRKCGKPVSGCTLIRDKKTKRFLGRAFVDFECKRAYKKALKLDGLILVERKISVQPKSQ